jgi:hypothetical protein
MTTLLQSTKEWLRSLDRRSKNHLKARNKIIKKLVKRKHILSFKIKRKLELNQELSENERAYVLRLSRSQHKDYILSKRKHGLLNADQITGLESMFDSRYSDKASLTKCQDAARDLQSSCSDRLPLLDPDIQMASRLQIHSFQAHIS